MKSWSEIENMPEFQNAPEDVQKTIQSRYLQKLRTEILNRPAPPPAQPVETTTTTTTVPPKRPLDVYGIEPLERLAFHAAKGFNLGTAQFAQDLADLAGLISWNWGIPAEDVRKKFTQFYLDNAAYWDKKAQELGPDAIADFAGTAIGALLPGLTKYAMGAKYAAASGAARGYREGGISKAIEQGLMDFLEWHTYDKLFQIVRPYNRIARAGLLGTGAGTVAAARAGLEGRTDKEALQEGLNQGLVMGAFGALSPGGEEKLIPRIRKAPPKPSAPAEEPTVLGTKRAVSMMEEKPTPPPQGPVPPPQGPVPPSQGPTPPPTPPSPESINWDNYLVMRAGNKIAGKHTATGETLTIFDMIRKGLKRSITRSRSSVSDLAVGDEVVLTDNRGNKMLIRITNKTPITKVELSSRTFLEDWAKAEGVSKLYLRNLMKGRGGKDRLDFEVVAVQMKKPTRRGGKVTPPETTTPPPGTTPPTETKVPGETTTPPTPPVEPDTVVRTAIFKDGAKFEVVRQLPNGELEIKLDDGSIETISVPGWESFLKEPDVTPGPDRIKIDMTLVPGRKTPPAGGDIVSYQIARNVPENVARMSDADIQKIIDTNKDINEETRNALLKTLRIREEYRAGQQTENWIAVPKGQTLPPQFKGKKLEVKEDPSNPNVLLVRAIGEIKEGETFPTSVPIEAQVKEGVSPDIAKLSTEEIRQRIQALSKATPDDFTHDMMTQLKYALKVRADVLKKLRTGGTVTPPESGTPVKPPGVTEQPESEITRPPGITESPETGAVKPPKTRAPRTRKPVTPPVPTPSAPSETVQGRPIKETLRDLAQITLEGPARIAIKKGTKGILPDVDAVIEGASGEAVRRVVNDYKYYKELAKAEGKNVVMYLRDLGFSNRDILIMMKSAQKYRSKIPPAQVKYSDLTEQEKKLHHKMLRDALIEIRARTPAETKAVSDYIAERVRAGDNAWSPQTLAEAKNRVDLVENKEAPPPLPFEYKPDTVDVDLNRVRRMTEEELNDTINALPRNAKRDFQVCAEDLMKRGYNRRAAVETSLALLVRKDALVYPDIKEVMQYPISIKESLQPGPIEIKEGGRVVKRYYGPYAYVASSGPVLRNASIPSQLIWKRAQFLSHWQYQMEQEFLQRLNDVRNKYRLVGDLERDVCMYLDGLYEPRANNAYDKTVVRAGREIREIMDDLYRLNKERDPSVLYLADHFPHRATIQERMRLADELRWELEWLNLPLEDALKTPESELPKQVAELMKGYRYLDELFDAIEEARSIGGPTKYMASLNEHRHGALTEWRWDFKVLEDYIRQATHKAYIDTLMPFAKKWYDLIPPTIPGRVPNLIAANEAVYVRRYLKAIRGSLGAEAAQVWDNCINQTTENILKITRAKPGSAAERKIIEAGEFVRDNLTSFAMEVNFLIKLGLNFFRYPIVNTLSLLPTVAVYTSDRPMSFLRGVMSATGMRGLNELARSVKLATYYGRMRSAQEAMQEVQSRYLRKAAKTVGGIARESEKIVRMITASTLDDYFKEMGLPLEKRALRIMYLIDLWQGSPSKATKGLAGAMGLTRQAYQFSQPGWNWLSYFKQLCETDWKKAALAGGVMAFFAGTRLVPDDLYDGAARLLVRYGIVLPKTSGLEKVTKAVGIDRQGIDVGSSFNPINLPLDPYDLRSYLGLPGTVMKIISGMSSADPVAGDREVVAAVRAMSALTKFADSFLTHTKHPEYQTYPGGKTPIAEPPTIFDFLNLTQGVGLRSYYINLLIRAIDSQQFGAIEKILEECRERGYFIPKGIIKQNVRYLEEAQASDDMATQLDNVSRFLESVVTGQTDKDFED